MYMAQVEYTCLGIVRFVLGSRLRATSVIIPLHKLFDSVDNCFCFL